MKKIRRTRIRTETSRLVFIQEQTGGLDEARGAPEVCPACGQPLLVPAKDSAALSPLCPERHDEDGVFDLKKKEK